MAQWHCRGDVGRGTMSLSSHAGDDIVISCWQWHCRGGVSRGVMLLPHLVVDGAVEVTLAEV
jgi:hypothetical protein